MLHKETLSPAVMNVPMHILKLFQRTQTEINDDFLKKKCVIYTYLQCHSHSSKHSNLTTNHCEFHYSQYAILIVPILSRRLL
jgi:hypothetical protein